MSPGITFLQSKCPGQKKKKKKKKKIKKIGIYVSCLVKENIMMYLYEEYVF